MAKWMLFASGLALIAGAAKGQYVAPTHNNGVRPMQTRPAQSVPRTSPVARPGTPVGQHIGVPAGNYATTQAMRTGPAGRPLGGGETGYRPGGTYSAAMPRPGLSGYQYSALAHPGNQSGLMRQANSNFGGRQSGSYAAPSRYMPGSRPAFSQRQFDYHGRSLSAVHAPVYRYAQGYNYRSFHVGMRVPPFLLMSDYFLTNYYLYNLAPPPGPGIMWVRFGPDALLVNTYTGDVIDTAPSMFDDSPLPPEEATGDDGPPPGFQSSDNSQPNGNDGGYPGPAGYQTSPQ